MGLFRSRVEVERILYRNLTTKEKNIDPSLQKEKVFSDYKTILDYTDSLNTKNIKYADQKQFKTLQDYLDDLEDIIDNLDDTISSYGLDEVLDVSGTITENRTINVNSKFLTFTGGNNNAFNDGVVFTNRTQLGFTLTSVGDIYWGERYTNSLSLISDNVGEVFRIGPSNVVINYQALYQPSRGIYLYGGVNNPLLIRNSSQTTTYFVVTNTGDIGIGTDTPLYDFDARLDIFALRTTNLANGFIFGVSNNPYLRIVPLSGGTGIYLSSYQGGLRVGTGTSATTELGMVHIKSKAGTDGLYIEDSTGASLFTVEEAGSLVAHEYGSGTFTGTATYLLGVTNTGDIIEVSPGVGGGSLNVGDYLQIPFVNITNDDFDYDPYFYYDNQSLYVGNPSANLDGKLYLQNSFNDSGDALIGYFSPTAIHLADIGASGAYFKLIVNSSTYRTTIQNSTGVIFRTTIASSDTTEGLFHFDSDVNDGINASSGAQSYFAIEARITQSGSASYSAFFLDVVEQSTGSGTKYLFNTNVGGTATFQILSSGKTYFNKYGVGTFTGTPANILTISASGELLEGGNDIITQSNLHPMYKGVVTLTGTSTTMNWLAGQYFKHSLTAATSISDTNLTAGKTIELLVVGNSQTLSLPGYYTIASGSYDPAKTNLFTIACFVSTGGSEQVIVSVISW